MVPKQSAAISFQETHLLNAIITTRSTYIESQKICNGLKPQECKHTKLREPPPIPYIPVKDKIQEKLLG